jgi:hypothetical protein
MEFERLELTVELSHFCFSRLLGEIALLLPFTWWQPSFWAQVSISAGGNIAKNHIQTDFKIKNLLWPIVIGLYIYKHVTSYQMQHYTDLMSLLSENRYTAKVINLLEGKKDFHTLAVMGIQAEEDPKILWISDSVLLLTNKHSH